MLHCSTTLALCSSIHDWLKELDSGNEICSVFFGLQKAFDSVPHNHLIDKLTTLNLCPHLLQWIHSYLCDRSQVVKLLWEVNYLLSRVLCQESLKALFWGHCCLLFILMMLHPKSLHLARYHFMQMTLPCIAASTHLQITHCCKLTSLLLQTVWKKKNT